MEDDWLGIRPHELRFDPDADEREPFLRVNKETLVVRHVKGVTLDTEDYSFVGTGRRSTTCSNLFGRF